VVSFGLAGGRATTDQFGPSDLAVVGKPVAVGSESSPDRDEARRSAAIAIVKVIHRKN
jgi:hypothetical protein